MLVIIIKNMKLNLNNKNPLLKKSRILFESYVQKSEKNKKYILFFYYSS